MVRKPMDTWRILRGISCLWIYRSDISWRFVKRNTGEGNGDVRRTAISGVWVSDLEDLEIGSFHASNSCWLAQDSDGHR